MKIKLMLLALVLLAFASPVFAQTTGPRGGNQLGGDHFRVRHGDRFRTVRPGAGQSRGGVRGRDGTQSRRVGRDPVRPDLGLVLIESLALYTLVIILLKVV